MISKIFLVQHGEAKPESEDPERPLSDNGIRQTEHIAQHIHSIGLSVPVVYHSGKLRARQTAEILGQKAFELIPKETDGLSPKDAPLLWKDRLDSFGNGNVMLVGHLPHLARLASLLLTGSMDPPVIAFRNSGIVCLVRDETGRWLLTWAITPDTLAGR